MRTADLKVLKTKLSEYVRLAAGGETVLVTDRDRVVAGRSPLAARLLALAIGNTTVCGLLGCCTLLRLPVGYM
jgi:antitoxin (DNA-binding transcriptional repressor) of toxin-antitoxin stability system